jgi:hypothetical protein
MSIIVAVVGAGRMGSVVAGQLPGDTQKIIIDVDLDKARLLAEKVEGVPSDNLDAAGDADLIAVVLPTPAVNETVAALLKVAKKGAIILNMATSARIDPALIKRTTEIAIVDAKIIGHAKSISLGEPGIIVVRYDDAEKFQFIKKQLPGFYKVIQGESDLVAEINKLASTEGIKAAVALRKQLSKMDVPDDWPDEWIDVAIRPVCAGTMKSFTENDLGHFALELVKKLEKELD